MPEVTLKELSDAAPPGPWALSPQELDDWGMIRAAFDPATGFRPVVCSIRSHDDEAEQAAARQEGRQPKSVQARADFIIALERAYRAGRLHDDTALATAVARARREALEEAAAQCEAHGRPLDDPYASAAEVERYANQHETCHMLAADLRALAATPPEARQTETGWKTPAGWKLVPEEATLAMKNAGWRDLHGQGLHIEEIELDGPYRAMIAAAPPPPAIGNLEGEVRSHG